MKKRIFSIVLISFIISVFFFVTSCREKDGPPGINKEELIDDALPVAQYMIAMLQSQEFGRLSNMWVQHLAGVSGNYSRLDKYEVNPDYLNHPWERIYFEAYIHLKTIFDYAPEFNATAHLGIAHILQAYLFSIATDVFGDIPYDEAAFYYQGGLPVYDDQEYVYERINNLILDGISLLESSISNNVQITDPEIDYMYEGDLNKWIKAAYVLRLRTTLKISNQDQNYNHTLSYLNEGVLFEGNNDNLYFPFDIHPDLPNPRYTFDSNIKQVRVGRRLVNLLRNNDDPRLPVFVTKNANQIYLGSGPGEANQAASYLGPGVASISAPVYFLTYSEQKFIKAEAYYRTGQIENAKNAYKEGVAASLQQFDVFDQEWFEENTNIEDISLEKIMNAKYIALFLNPESWADWRRTGYPVLSVAQGSFIGSQHPRRYPYPGRENQFNSDNMPQGVEITDRLWWDVP